MLEFSYLVQTEDEYSSESTHQLQLEEYTCCIPVHLSQVADIKDRTSVRKNALETILVQKGG